MHRLARRDGRRRCRTQCLLAQSMGLRRDQKRRLRGARTRTETPGRVGDFVDELSFGGGGGFVLIEKLLDVALVGFGVLSGRDGGAGGETVVQRVRLRRDDISHLG